MLQAQLFIDADELQDTTPLYEFILQFLLYIQTSSWR